jgi:hypothetical protein
MKIKEVTAMPLGKVAAVNPGGTDPSKTIVNIKTADGKDIQTTADQLIQGPNNTYQLKTADVSQSGSELKPGAVITQSPDQASSGATMGTTATTQEEQGDIGGDGTDDFISDVSADETDEDLNQIKRLSGI